MEEFVQCQRVVRSVKADHIELLPQPIKEIDCSRSRIVRSHLKQENAFRHLNPTRGNRFSKLEKFMDRVLNVRLRVAQTHLPHAEHTIGTDVSSTLLHTISFVLECALVRIGQTTAWNWAYSSRSFFKALGLHHEPQDS